MTTRRSFAPRTPPNEGWSWSMGSVAEMIALTRWILHQRALAARRDWSSQALYAVVISAGIGLFTVIALGSYVGARTLAADRALKLLHSIPSWAFLIYLFTDIFIAFGQALGDLYMSADMPLLLVMPLRTSSIVVAKFVAGVVQNEMYVAAILAPFVIGFFAGTHAPLWAYPVALLAVAVFPAMLYAVLACVTILALRYIPGRHAKETLWILGAVVPTIFWVASFSGISEASGDLASIHLPPLPNWLPSTWTGNVVAFLAQREPLPAFGWLLCLLFAAVVVCPAALAFISRSFERGWSESLMVPKRAGRVRVRKQLAQLPWIALLQKDVWVLMRTPQLWFSHITSLGFVAYLLVGHKAQTPLMPLTIQLAMAQIGFVAILAGLNPGMTALSLEHGSAWLLKSTPLDALDILKSKLAITWFQTAVVVTLGAGAIAYGYGLNSSGAGALVAFALLMALCSVCCGIAFDTTFPSFHWENPNSINRGIRMVVPFLAGVAVLLVCAAFLAMARVLLHGAEAVVVGLVLSLLTVALVAERTLRTALRNIAALEL